MQPRHVGVHTSVDEVFPPDRLVAALESTDVAVSIVDAETDAMDAIVTFAYEPWFASSVDWIHSIQAGVDRFPLEGLSDAGVVLTNSSGIHGDSVGEMVAGYLVSLARDLHGYARNQAETVWERPDWDRAFTLTGERCCVVGLGTLGRGIVARARALGMAVVGVRRSGEPVEDVDRVYTPDALEEAVADARFVVVAVPLDETTRRLVDASVFEAMRSDAYLVNVARGGVVDEDELVAALRSGSIAGAALDVFEEEPLPASSPLWAREDVLITPHVAATVQSYYEDVAELVAANLRRAAADRPFENRVV